MGGTVKLKTCRVCKAKFTPHRQMQRVCSPKCALEGARTARERIARQKSIQHTREARERLKTRSTWIREAQAAFNAYIRERDAGLSCICCGRYGTGHTRGGEWDAGHYRSRGSAPHLRFDPRNCHAQLKQCNRYGSGNVVGYRKGLIERIGLEALEALEADQVSRKWSVDELRAIRDDYRARLKALRAK